MRAAYWFGGLALSCATPLFGQVVELSGGSSTLYQSQGATLKLHGSRYESALSGGVADGHFIAGSYLRWGSPATSYTVGMQEFNFNLPTDLFSGDHRLNTIGLGVKTRIAGTQVQGFLGAASTRLDSPFVQGFTRLQPAAALLLKTELRSHLSLSTQLFDASTLTLIESLSWKARRGLELAASLGFAGTQHYAAVSMDLRKPRHDLALQYVSTGDEFHRTGTDQDQAPEFVHENLSYTYRSSIVPRFTFTVIRQNFLIPGSETPGIQIEPVSTDFPPVAPVVTPASISGLDQASAVEQVGRLHLSQSVFHSSYEGESNLAYAVGLSTSFTRRFELQSSLFKSYLLHTPARPVSSLVTTLRERLTSRLSISQTVNYSSGQPTIGFGGALLSGVGVLSVDYQTVYIPTRPENPFQQSLMLDLQLSIFGRLLLHAGTFVSPAGKLLYTIDAHGAQGISHSSASSATHPSLGNSVLSARVVDEAGNPVEGAALEIDGKLLYTDSAGSLFLRESKPSLHQFKVAVDDFLDGRIYRVVSQPMQIASSKAVQPPSVIVVAVAAQ